MIVRFKMVVRTSKVRGYAGIICTIAWNKRSVRSRPTGGVSKS